MSIGSITITLKVDTHGALESTHFGIVRRTLALWCIAFAQRLLRTRYDISFEKERS